MDNFTGGRITMKKKSGYGFYVITVGNHKEYTKALAEGYREYVKRPEPCECEFCEKYRQEHVTS